MSTELKSNCVTKYRKILTKKAIDSYKALIITTINHKNYACINIDLSS